MPATAWAASVNLAFQAGVAVFAASGNRLGPAPPANILGPARFGRMTAEGI